MCIRDSPCSIRKWKYGDGKKIVVEIIADSDRTTPVSYTHLDVYKRQVSENVGKVSTQYSGRGYKYWGELAETCMTFQTILLVSLQRAMTVLAGSPGILLHEHYE